MKKQRLMTAVTVGLTFGLMLLFGLTGCGSSDGAAPEESAVAVEDAAEEADDETVVEAAGETADSAHAEKDAVTIKEQQKISEKEAMKIAREDAGIAESDISNSSIHVDYDEGKPRFEVEFRQDTKEYEYTIDAFTGEILEKDID